VRNDVAKYQLQELLQQEIIIELTSQRLVHR